MFSIVFTIIFSIILFHVFKPIYTANELIISYGIHPFDICSKNPQLWKYIKTTFIFTSIFSNFLIGYFIYNRFLFNLYSLLKNLKSNTNSKKQSNLTVTNHSKNFQKNSLSLKIGQELYSNKIIYIPENGLYQNFLITGTIGSGKTSSAMYPFTRQLLKYNSSNRNNKIGMLILDVKGNYYNQVKKYANTYNLDKDLIVLELGSNIFYNPLHKPNLKARVLANRLKTILLLFSENNSESYWLDKAEEVLSECIKLCRLYNHGYVTFVELHKLITQPNYYREKIKVLKDLFIYYM